MLLGFTAKATREMTTMSNEMQTEVLESYCLDSRVHAIIDNPVTEGIDEG